MIAAFFLAGMALVVFGWSLTGKLEGLGIMILGIVFLLVALWIYNKRFTEPKRNKRP